MLLHKYVRTSMLLVWFVFAHTPTSTRLSSALLEAGAGIALKIL
jgi:hypothetical protein